jgi:predicted O-methyltransferase YrrM
VFIDADKENNLAYTQWALQYGSENVTIVVDNVVRDGRVIDPTRPEKLEFIKFLATYGGINASVIQTVGSKGWDGFVLIKRSDATV